MGHILSEIIPFLASVFSHWQIWLSGGGLGGVIVIGASLVERWFEKPLSKRAHVYLFLIAFFLCSCFLSWVDRDDAWHVASQQILTEKEQYTVELQKAHNDYGALQAKCQYQSGVVDTLGKQNRDQQNTINGCQSQALRLLEPTPLHIEAVKTPVSANASSIQYILLTNRVISPVSLTVECNQDIDAVALGPIAETHVVMLPQESWVSRREYKISFAIPAWTPTYPLVATITLQKKNLASACMFAPSK